MPARRPPQDRARFTALHSEFLSIVSQFAQMAEDEGAEGLEAVATAVAWSQRILSDIQMRAGLTTSPSPMTTPQTPMTTSEKTMTTSATTDSTTTETPSTTAPKKSKTTAPPELVARIRALRDSGMSQRAIVDKLNQEEARFRTHGGGKKWHLIQVQRILAASID